MTGKEYTSERNIRREDARPAGRSEGLLIMEEQVMKPILKEIEE